MASDVKIIDGQELLKCKECKTFKVVGPELWYKHKEGYKGVLGRCKSCIKKGRKTGHELAMARKRDMDRYCNNTKRNKYIKKSSLKRRKEKGYGKIHTACARRIKILGIRPKICPICNKYHKRIEAHHFDYMLIWKIIFCCSICHSKLDRGIIDHKSCAINDIEPLHYKSKTKGIKHTPF